LAEKKDIISVKKLSFSYNRDEVLHDLNFDVSEGDFISILGPNGSGKSTLVNLISRVLKDYRGRIQIRGTDIRKLSSYDVAKMVAVVPQYTNPGFDFTVFEMIMMGRFPYFSRFGTQKKEDLDIVRDVMKRTETSSFAGRKYSELSGGEKQRVVIAQALAQNSTVLLLDEPTSHLDINFQIEFMNLFLSLNKKESRTVIGIFHDINLAIQNSRKIMLLNEGRICSFGSTEEIINRENISHVFGSNIFIGKNPVTKKLYVSPIFSPSASGKSRGKELKKKLRVHVIGGGGAASPVMDLLCSAGYEVSCGVVNTLDTDHSTAQMLGIPYVSEAPFSPISRESQDKNLEFIRSSEVVILPGVELGHGNFSNLLSVKEALKLNKKVIIIDEKSISKRDHTGGKAEKLYRSLLKGGAVVIRSYDQVLKNL
jgi:iron complex transport system ATP-binding protein